MGIGEGKATREPKANALKDRFPPSLPFPSLPLLSTLVSHKGG